MRVFHLPVGDVCSSISQRCRRDPSRSGRRSSGSLKSRARALHRAGSNVPMSWTTRPDKRVTWAAAAMAARATQAAPSDRIARIHGPS